MSRGNQTFRQADVVRAVKAMRAAGESVARVEIDREGKIVVFIGAPACAESEKRLTPEQEATERFFTKQGQAK